MFPFGKTVPPAGGGTGDVAGGAAGDGTAGAGGGKVVPLSRFAFMRRFRNGRSLSPLGQAEAYWSALREGGGLPARARIDPRALDNILHHCFILERTPAGTVRFRLAGQTLHRLTGCDPRGRSATAPFAAPHRPAAARLLRGLFAEPAIAEAELEAGTAEARMILLPLTGDDGSVSRALGVLVSGEDDAGPAPLTIAAARLRPVPGLAPPARAPLRTSASGSAGATAVPAAGRAGRAGFLRVVPGRDAVRAGCDR